eukprot:gb/GFBE01019203.1/.p1 GENE.gb/GFBE01019203.1/~~gb/GFBE01019203.1/.p1  ORF type:complete len:579 (+),score=135.15 gb/GFBE01019203.1/:1-1737(+)
MAQDQASAAAAGGGAVKKPELPSKERLLFALTKLLGSKGDDYIIEVKRKAAAGTFEVKGIKISEDMVKEALARARSEQAAAAKETIAANAAAGLRWTPSSSSIASLADKAMQECEHAEPYSERIRVTGGNKVAVLPRPDVTSNPTGEYVPADQWTEAVARTVNRKDGRVYVRLRNFTGWVSTRSRKDFTRTVLEVGEGRPPIEPPAVQVMSRGRAMRLLAPFSEEGKPLMQQSSSVGPPEVRRFRTTIGTPILQKPDLAGLAPEGRLSAREEFIADGAFLRQSDGRAYLHLKDGRGWVCERAKGDFSRLAVEPCGPTDDVADDVMEDAGVAQPLRARAGGRKVIMVERSVEDAAAAADAVGKDASLPGSEGTTISEPAPAERVFRSDGEIWPEELGAPKPIGKDLRVKLRRLYSFYGLKVKECEEDIKELTDKASGFGRACPAQKELLEYAEKLRKELQKVKKEWGAAAKATLDPAKAAEAPPAPAKRSDEGSIMPVQVRGSRWFCATAAGVVAEDESGGPASRLIGPLRLKKDEAEADLKRMLEAKKAPDALKRKEATKESESLPPAKRGRLKKEDK